MPIAAFTQTLTFWLWLSIFGAGAQLYLYGPQPRFWLLLLSAFSSWTSIWLFERSSDPDGPLRPRKIRRDGRPEK